MPPEHFGKAGLPPGEADDLFLLKNLFDEAGIAPRYHAPRKTKRAAGTPLPGTGCSLSVYNIAIIPYCYYTTLQHFVKRKPTYYPAVHKNHIIQSREKTEHKRDLRQYKYCKQICILKILLYILYYILNLKKN